MDWRQRPWWLWAFAGLVALAAVILAIWKLPSLLYGDVSKASADARLQAASGFRTAFVAGLAGLAALISLAIANRTYRLTQQGQITDRYTKAIDQLGSDKPEIRVGGIYALERIAKDSDQDRVTVVEVLTAFVRDRAPWPPRQPDQPGADTPIEAIPPLATWAMDVQAALTVLGRRKPPIDPAQRLDLTAMDLRGVDLRRAKLQGAELFQARLQKAMLLEADLQDAHLRAAGMQGAFLRGARLQRANLAATQLQDADFSDAELQNAVLLDAELQNAVFEGAHLQGANLWGANLQGAWFLLAQLQGAELRGADLTEAHLSGANLQGANLTDARLQGARSSANTVWPDGFDWKAAGVILH